MGLFYLVSRLTITSVGTLYPIYLSYKAIRSNDLASLETLLMYWVVMGTVSAAEGTVEWLVNWFPFYYEIKTLVILWLTLPQIQGSTFVYLTYIHPFLLSHETDIDAALSEAKGKARKAGEDYFKSAVEKLKELVLGVVAPSLLATPDNADAQTGQPRPSDYQYATHPAHQRPHPAGQPAQNGAQAYAAQLLRTYGPAAYAAGAALLHPMAHRPPAPRTHVPAPPPHAATDAATAASTATSLDEGPKVLRKRNPSSTNLSASSRSSPGGSSTSLPSIARSPTPTTGTIAGKRTQTPTQVQVDEFIAREKARRREKDSQDAAAAVTPPTSRRWSFFGGGAAPVKDGPTPDSSSPAEVRQRVPSASPLGGTERSLYGGFEEIGRDEVEGRAGADDAVPEPASASRGRWFGWGGRPIEEAASSAAKTK